MHFQFSFHLLLVGLFLSYFFYKTESLLLCIILHYQASLSRYLDIIYVYLSNKKLIEISALEYSSVLLFFLLGMYYSLEYVFGRDGLDSFGLGT